VTVAYLDEFQRVVGNGAGPAWLRNVRHDAIERFSTLGFPTQKNEDWHFTSVAPIADATFRSLAAESARHRTPDVTPHLFGHTEWPRLVFLNGRLSPELSRLTGLSRGMRVLPLTAAWQEMPELVQSYLAQIASFDDRSFAALNTALMADGAVVHIARDAAPEMPIHLLFLSDSHATDGVAQMRNLVVAERGSKATVVESYASIGAPRYFNNVVTEMRVEDGATVNHLRVQRESPAAFHVSTTEVSQGRDSHFLSFSFATGAALSRTNIYTTLDGAGCGATLNGLYMVDGQQHVDHQTRIEHAKPSCFSRELYKGILDGESHGVFNGKVYVQPEAQKTDGKQTNANLLLSNRARIDTKPQLEIFADDVKCTHGATVGRPDETALFYMKSRGISRELARRLITYAFAADVLETIELVPVREQLEAFTLARFAPAAA